MPRGVLQASMISASTMVCSLGDCRLGILAPGQTAKSIRGRMRASQYVAAYRFYCRRRPLAVVPGLSSDAQLRIGDPYSAAYPRHCERSEAIHRAAKKARMDCFVASAPRNDGRYSFAVSRRDAPEVL